MAAKCKNLGKEMAAMLTEDLISEILVRLPVKSLLLCRCVCKAWLHLIDSRSFVDMHLQHSITKTDRILLSRSLEDWTNNLSIHDYDSFDVITSFNMDPHLDYFSLIISGPCNGLLCLIDYDCNLVLYNPSLGVYKSLPPRPFPCRKGWKYDVKGFGLGFVSNPNDYKVISLVSFYHVDSESDDDDNEDIEGDVLINEDDGNNEDNVGIEDGEENYDDEDEPTDKVEIYDLSTNSWREIMYAYPYSIDGNEYGTLFKGALHWTSCRDHVDIILTFDMSTEAFRDMELPNDHIRKDGAYKSLTVVNDSLALFVYTGYYQYPEEQFVDIWVMRQYGVAESWNKQISIGPITGINRPLMLWKNETILLESIEGQLLSCSVDTNEIEEFEIDGMKGLLRVMVFQESLISL